jgi:hypothetical protein
MKRRKRSDDNPKPGSSCCPGMSLVVPAFLARWVSGAEVARARYQAPVWNLGTARLDVFDRVLMRSA